MLFDNHESHITMPIIHLAKASSVILMASLLLASHKMQLDNGDYSLFKVFYNKAVTNWIDSPRNAPKFITVHNIDELTSIAHFKAVVLNNIMKV